MKEMWSQRIGGAAAPDTPRGKTKNCVEMVFLQPAPGFTLPGKMGMDQGWCGEVEESCPLFTSKSPGAVPCLLAASWGTGPLKTHPGAWRLTPHVTPESKQAGLWWQRLPLLRVPLSTARKNIPWRSLRRLKPDATDNTEDAGWPAFQRCGGRSCDSQGNPGAAVLPAPRCRGQTPWLPCRPAPGKLCFLFLFCEPRTLSPSKNHRLQAGSLDSRPRTKELSSEAADMTGQNLACQQRARLSHAPYSSLPPGPSGRHSWYSLRIIRQERGHTGRRLGLPSMHTASELGGGEEGRPNWQ